ncbi:hypothetical protein LX32DRAFT_326744 [Colletotrichum zoysiae]|uniref:Uncharacterized protein n=1 Tax=Colletotrichum zoysiae TaxID=1216348 RepID=A0AAD9HMH4_9PEZI|nr:hypothetical protein LX32DRAFT_326744 [Colletotrichum zoysiae]
MLLQPRHGPPLSQSFPRLLRPHQMLSQALCNMSPPPFPLATRPKVACARLDTTCVCNERPSSLAYITLVVHTCLPTYLFARPLPNSANATTQSKPYLLHLLISSQGGRSSMGASCCCCCCCCTGNRTLLCIPHAMADTSSSLGTRLPIYPTVSLSAWHYLPSASPVSSYLP